MTETARPAPSLAAVGHEADGRALRRAFGAFATGVTVIACCRPEGGFAALTANSFASLSLDPPLLLWSLARRAPSFPAFSACEAFSINVLGAGQQGVADRFARASEDKFAGVAHRLCPLGTPILDQAVATYICRNEARHDGGDHVIFVGRIAFWQQQEAEPLVFFGGRYRALADA